MDKDAKLRWKHQKEKADKMIAWGINNPPDSPDLLLRSTYADGMMAAVSIINHISGGASFDPYKKIIESIIECKNVIEEAE